MQKAIILAAGRGERLVNGHPFPKPMKLVNGVPLIVRVLRSLERAGVDEAVVVVGYLSDVLIDALQDYQLGIRVLYVHNDEWDKPNGTSLLKAREHVTGATFLLMSDHLWSQDLLAAVGRYPLAADEAVLGIDFKIDACFDLEDATKVAIVGDRIASIGKELGRYQALDTGVFRITPAVIDALDAVEGPDGCSLSQGMAQLASEGRMRAVDVERAAWIDVDTPQAHAEAERLLRRHGNDLRPRRRVHSAAE